MNEITINKLKMYSPSQVLCGTLFFGPLTMIYFLWRNFNTLGKSNAAKYTLIFGGIFILGLILFLSFLPKQIISTITQCIYSVAALQLVASLQMSSDDIRKSIIYKFEPIWRIVIYGIPLFALWLFIFYRVTEMLAALSVIN